MQLPKQAAIVAIGSATYKNRDSPTDLIFNGAMSLSSGFGPFCADWGLLFQVVLIIPISDVFAGFLVTSITKFATFLTALRSLSRTSR